MGLFLVVALWQLPRRQLGPRLDNLGPGGQLYAENAARLTLAQIMGGLFLFIGLVVGWRQLQVTDQTVRLTQQGLQITQEGQITERFTRAIEQLGSEKAEVRLGGIYALERISQDSSRDYQPVIDVLSSFVRQRAPRDSGGKLDPATAPEPPLTFLEDAQAALTVLLRRDLELASYRCLDLSNTDLRGARFVRPGYSVMSLDLENVCLRNSDLTGAVLDFAHLKGAYLEGAILSGAQLYTADLMGAFLGNADLSNADLGVANLTGADLHGANLADADLSHADLSGEMEDAGHGIVNVRYAYTNLNGANLRGTNLSGADLSGVDLSRVQNLTQAQVDSAWVDSETVLPAGLHRPAGIAPPGTPTA